jgi:cytochrome P450
MTDDELLASPSFYGEGDFRSLFARLRRDDPVHWTTQARGRGFWSLFRHADVSRVLDDPAGFSSEREGIMPLVDPDQEEHAKSAYGLGEGVVVIDPPRHAAYRKAISAPFVPKALRDSEARTREIIAEIFDRLPDHGEIDLVEDLGAKIPMAVICDVLSIPLEDWDRLLRWGRMAIGGNDPEFRHGLTAGEAIAKGFGDLSEYSGKLAESRRGCRRSRTSRSAAAR